MPRRFNKTQAAKAAVLREHISPHLATQPLTAQPTATFDPVDDVSQELSDFSLSHADARRLWFIPSILQFPQRVQTGAKHSKKREASHVPKPRNVFFLFRSLFVHRKVLPTRILFCKDNCQVSRIVSHVWHALPDGDQAQFHEFDEEEKRAHKVCYPAYQWTPGMAKKTTFSTSTSPSNEEDMNPEQLACKRIADLVLKNLQGEELANKIQEVLNATIPAGWSNTATLSSNRKAALKASKTASRNLARQMKKSVKNSQLPSKVRSSSSSSKQSKASLDRTYAGLMNRPRRQTAVCYFEEPSDDEDEEVTSDNDAECRSSQCSMPPPSLTSEDVSMASTDNSADIETPSRFSSPPFINGTLEHSFDWANDEAIHQPAFDRASSFEPFEDNCGPVSDYSYDSLNSQFLSGIHAHHPAKYYSDGGVQDMLYPEVQPALLAQDFMDIQPMTISPALLHI